MEAIKAQPTSKSSIMTLEVNRLPALVVEEGAEGAVLVAFAAIAEALL